MNNLLNFKSFLKFLGRNKAYTLIDVFGLSVSLMFVLLIAVYTVQEMSTDKFHTKADRIYLVGNENWMATGAAIPYKIKERYPEVEKECTTSGAISASGRITKSRSVIRGWGRFSAAPEGEVTESTRSS